MELLQHIKTMMNTEYTYSFASIALFSLVILNAAILRRLSLRKVDPREPPVLPSTVPFIGHIYGIINYGASYFKYLSFRHAYPIFTLPTLTGRTYVVVEPGVAASVQRASKALSFNPLIPEITTRVLGFDAKTKRIIAANIDRDGPVRGFYPDVQDTVYSHLSPGPVLDDLNMRAYTEFLRVLDQQGKLLRVENGLAKDEDLMLWIKHIVSIATARFLYGPENPIAVHPELEQAFWDFVHGIPLLLLGILPSFTARKAYRAREALTSGFLEYLSLGRETSASAATQARIGVGRKHGFSVMNLARSEVSFLFAGMINTAFASFWMVLHIVAKSDLLADVRQELEGTMIAPNRISISRITRSPLLLAVFRESLRLHSEVLSSRVVTTKDYLLQDKYVLRQGSFMQISGGVMHNDPKIWGDSVADFDHTRFSTSPNGQAKIGGEKQRSVHPAAFRPFGGGATLCPGRHFAQAEILGLAAMLLLKFDLQPLVPGEAIKVPGHKDNVLPLHILEPNQEVHVRITLRKGWEENTELAIIA